MKSSFFQTGFTRLRLERGGRSSEKKSLCWMNNKSRPLFISDPSELIAGMLLDSLPVSIRL